MDSAASELILTRIESGAGIRISSLASSLDYTQSTSPASVMDFENNRNAVNQLIRIYGANWSGGGVQCVGQAAGLVQ